MREMQDRLHLMPQSIEFVGLAGNLHSIDRELLESAAEVSDPLAFEAATMQAALGRKAS